MTRSAFPFLSLTLLLTMPIAHAQAELEPADFYNMRQAAEIAYNDRDADAAHALYLKLTKKFPDDSEMWFGLSRACEWSENLGCAINAAERVQELGYFSRSYLSYRLAQLNERAGHSDEALTWIGRALQEGYQDRPLIQTDDVFSGLHEKPEFIRLAAMLPSQPVNRIDGIQFDIDYLVEEAQRMHADPERPAFSARFKQKARELRDAVPEMDDAEVLTGIMSLLALLGDGHTGVYGPDPDSPLKVSRKMLPLKFYWFAEGVYIVDGIGSAADYSGNRVLKFGDLSVAETLQRLSAYRGLDNPMMWKWMGPQFYLGQLQMLNQVGAAASTDSIELTLQSASGRVSVQNFDGGNQRATRKLRPSPAAIGIIPMYLSNIDTEYWTQSFPEKKTVYFQFNQVRNNKEQSIADFAKQLAVQLRNEEASTLIVDVRHNNGGNNTLVRPIVQTLVSFQQASADNQIYVITGRNTFSAAQNFVNRIERLTDAIFVGEPSSSRPNFVGEDTNLLLPYSRIRGSISTRYWQDSDPGDNRVWITPKVPVEPTAADYFAGRDAAVDTIFRLVGFALDR